VLLQSRNKINHPNIPQTATTIVPTSKVVAVFIQIMIEIKSLNDSRVAMFANMTEAQLRNRLEPEKGIFIAESPKVIRIALNSGYEPVALLAEKKHLVGDASDIVGQISENVPVYYGSRELLEQLTGYTLTRGVLCAMKRPRPDTVEKLCADARRIVIIDGVTDTTNIGSIFRSAAALGMDAILLTPTSCDPLNRRSIRVSMGTVFQIPWGWCRGDMSDIKSNGFKTVAMALRNNSTNLDSPELKAESKLAIVLGTEGDGLSENVISKCDYTVTIPMYHGVDSLNVGAAAAIAIWELR